MSVGITELKCLHCGLLVGTLGAGSHDWVGTQTSLCQRSCSSWQTR